VTASFAVSGDTAVVEMAEAAGLRRLPGGRPAPLTAESVPHLTDCWEVVIHVDNQVGSV
jgi:hypothetical protein